MMSNSKSYLNQYSQKKHIASPLYETERTGEGFFCTVTIEEAPYSSLSSHPTKKEAEIEAAGVAVHAIIQTHPTAKNFEDVLRILEQIMPLKSKKRSKQPESTSSVGPEFVPVSATNDTATASQQLPFGYTVPNVPPGIIYSPQIQIPESNVAPLHRPPIISHRPLLVGNVPSPNGIPMYYNTHATHPRAPPGFGPTSHTVPYRTIHKMPPSRVYPNHPIIPRAQQPVNIHPGRIIPRGQINVRMPVMEPGSSAIMNSMRHDMPRPLTSNIPLSVVGPSIADLPSPTQNQDKPWDAIPVKPFKNTPPVTTTLVTNSLASHIKPQYEGSTENTNTDKVSDVSSAENTDRDVRDLEEYCRSRNLPGPVYTIGSDKGKHFGKVKIGEMEFSRGWKYDSFNDAKDSAAIVAIAGLAMSLLHSSGKVKGSSLPASPKTPQTPKLPSSNQTQISQGTLNPGQVRILKRVQPSSPVSVVPSVTATLTTSASLQTPAFFQQPIAIVARGGGDILTSQLHTSQQQRDNNSSTSDIQVLPQQAQSASNMSVNFKSELNLYCQRNHCALPFYTCTSPDNVVGYVATVTVSGTAYNSSVHVNKRVAEADAAQSALKALGALSLSDQENVQTVGISVPKQVASSAPSVTTSSKFISYKNLLQEKAQKDKVSTPHYVTERSDKIEGYVSSTPHPVKKAAEQEAARLACIELKLIEK